eukprot:2784771-Ditylum_brightwellii.AAC.1
MSNLIKQNKLHLNQAFDTPSANRLLKDYIGESGMASDVDDILDVIFDSNVEDNLPAVNYWLKNKIRRKVPK